MEVCMRLGTIAVVLTLCGAVCAQGTSAERAQRELERVRAECGAPGMSAAVVVGDEVAWSGVAGQADVELGVAVTPETKFRLGSVCKVLTGTLAAKLASEGKIDLDVDVRTYVKDWPAEGPAITLRQLLGHLGGVRHYTGKDFDNTQPGGMIDLRLYPDTASMLALFKGDPLVARPGEQYAYSTFGYTLVSAAIEGATGKPFEVVMREELLAPMGLGDEIVADDVRAIIAGRSAFYDRAGRMDSGVPEGTVVRGFPINSAYKRAAGGYVADAEAVARFGTVVFGPGVVDSGALEEMLTVQKSADGKETGVGLGWRIGKDEQGRTILHHAGAQMGCRAVLVVYPKERVSVAVLSNLTGTPQDIEKVGRELAANFLQGAP